MKKLSKLSLLKLEKESLSDQEMRCLKGGFDDCTCGCHYNTYKGGGSSTGNNDGANYQRHLHSYGGGFESCACTGNTNHAQKSEFMIGGNISYSY